MLQILQLLGVNGVPGAPPLANRRRSAPPSGEGDNVVRVLLQHQLTMRSEAVSRHRRRGNAPACGRPSEASSRAFSR